MGEPVEWNEEERKMWRMTPAEMKYKAGQIYLMENKYAHAGVII